MKQPRFYMTAIFCDPNKNWLVLFSLAKSKKRAAEIAFDWMSDLCRNGSTSNSLQKYTSVVFCDAGQYWVRPRGWNWSVTLSDDLTSYFSSGNTEAKDIESPLRPSSTIPTALEDVAFVFGEDSSFHQDDYFPPVNVLARQSDRNLKRFARRASGHGEHQFDIRQELQRYGDQQGYPVDYIVDCKCDCGATVFELLIDSGEGVAQRVCVQCGVCHTLGDGSEYLNKAQLLPRVCDCDKNAFEISVGIHVYRDASNDLSDHARWQYLGVRCPHCERVQVAGDWKNDYQPASELLSLM